MKARPQIDVLICSFQRPHLVRTLASIAAQIGHDAALHVILADNDETDCKRAEILRAAADLSLPLTYLHAPARNISIARNAGLAASDADWVAFIDDDETAPAGWLAGLLDAARQSGADAVFGPAVAIYEETAPRWMVGLDLHSNRPVLRRGRVDTGHTCNALLRWRGTPWQRLRFDLARGRSGGEDTAFFFALADLGARFGLADCPVFEPVDPARLSLRWLARRRFRMGQSHGSLAVSAWRRTALFATALAKAAYCLGASLIARHGMARRFWWLRGALHCGVCAGCLSMRQPTLYGG
ncbi:MAG: glycosyltransferase family 2 protein [Pseudomonadota bacterium]